MSNLLRKLRSSVKQIVAPAVQSLPLPPMELNRAALATLDASKPFRCGIVGMGMMGRVHADVLKSRPHFRLAGITSSNPEKKSIATELGCRWFDSAAQMIGSGEIDVVIIATPHWNHAEVAIAALEAGLHVVCEKPLAVTVSQADAIFRAAQSSRGKLTVVSQSRFEPSYMFVKSMLDRAELGPVIRCEMLETGWRPQAYYKASAWRGTWKGEGGGVLLNQAPHVLDRYIWFFGAPDSVTGFCDTSLHQIEVEDSATATLRHAGGVHGQLHVSTNECPGMARTVIACDRGKIVIENGVVTVSRLAASIRERTSTETRFFGEIESTTEVRRGETFGWSPEQLGLFMDDVALSLAGKSPVLVTPDQAIKSVELANAIMLSSAKGCAVKLPIDRGEFDSFIASKTTGA